MAVKWNVGDLAWARVGGCPYWPCMVIKDHIENLHFKIKILKGNVLQKSIHVQFFGDRGRRSWLLSHCIIPFEGLKSFDELAATTKKETKDRKNLAAFVVRATVKVRWTEAVEEAEQSMMKSRLERLDEFSELFPQRTPKVQSRKRKPDGSGGSQLSLPKQLKLQLGSSSVSPQPKIFSPKKKLVGSKIEQPRVGSKNRPRKKRQPKPDLDGPKRVGRHKKMVPGICQTFVRRHLQREMDGSKCSEKEAKRHLMLLWSKMPLTNRLAYVPLHGMRSPAPLLVDASSSSEEDDGGALDEGSMDEGGALETVIEPRKKSSRLLLEENIKPEDFILKAKKAALKAKVNAQKVFPMSQSADLSSSKQVASTRKEDRNGAASLEGKNVGRRETRSHSGMPIEVKEAVPGKARPQPTTPPRSKSHKPSPDEMKDMDKSVVPVKVYRNKKYVSDEESEGSCTDSHDGPSPLCFICSEVVDLYLIKQQRCAMENCDKFYHLICLKKWKHGLSKDGTSQRRSWKDMDQPNDMTCPSHFCHTCSWNGPSNNTSKFQDEDLFQCLLCPMAYHKGNHCLPAGVEVLPTSQIICPMHCRPLCKTDVHIKTTWCYFCANDGSLITCDRCPRSFHAGCFQASPPEGHYTCKYCNSGRFPRYGEVVWVKLGTFRWWPAKILYTSEIPYKITSMSHAVGEFAVLLFGSHEHHWVNRRCVTWYQEGDTGGHSGSYKVDVNEPLFQQALKEALTAHKTHEAGGGATKI